MEFVSHVLISLRIKLLVFYKTAAKITFKSKNIVGKVWEGGNLNYCCNIIDRIFTWRERCGF